MGPYTKLLKKGYLKGGGLSPRTLPAYTSILTRIQKGQGNHSSFNRPPPRPKKTKGKKRKKRK